MPPSAPPVAAPAGPSPTDDVAAEDVEEADLLLEDVEVDVIESIEPLAISSLPAGASVAGAASLVGAEEALAPPPLPGFPEVESDPAAASSEALMGFFIDAPDTDDAGSRPSLDDAPTELLEAESLRPATDALPSLEPGSEIDVGDVMSLGLESTPPAPTEPTAAASSPPAPSPSVPPARPLSLAERLAPPRAPTVPAPRVAAASASQPPLGEQAVRTTAEASPIDEAALDFGISADVGIDEEESDAQDLGALDIDVDALPRPRSAAPSALDVSADGAPRTLEALEAELFADTPRVDLGAAAPSDAGFADLALADDELDAMFRDLEVVSEVTTPAPSSPPPPTSADPGDDLAAFESALDEAPALDDGDDDALIIAGDEEELDIDVDAPADRGALLAATVTSRRREQQPSDALYGLDPRSEAQARVDLLSEEAGQDASYPRAAEHLGLVAETLEGALGDVLRARNLAERAVALAPETFAAARLLRRLDIAEGRELSAYQRVLDELQAPLGDEERASLLRVAAELAARVAPGDAAAHWDALAAHGRDTHGALAALFAASHRRDQHALAAALARWSERSSGELSASLAVARARLVESDDNDDALDVIRDAVRRDPYDAGAWIAMARIAFARVRADVAAEALAGLARAGGSGATATSAAALGASIRAIVGQSVPPTPISDAGVSGWLMLHAQEESGGDPAAQLTASLDRASPTERAAWQERAGASTVGAVGRFHALRATMDRRDEPAVAGALAALIDASAGAKGALLALADGVSEPELAALRPVGGALAGILSASLGDPPCAARADDPFAQIDVAERARREDERGVEDAISSLAEVASSSGDAAAASFAARTVAALAGEPSRVVEMLKIEAMRSRDARRSAASRIIATALSAAYGVADGAEGIAEAAAALPGDPAVAELAALLALRGELDPEIGAELLDQASTVGDDRAHHTAAVRAALRRAAVDPDSAAESVWRAWMRCSKDVALGTLVLRSPGQPAERVAAVLRTQIDGAHGAGAQGATAAIAEGLLLSSVLEGAGRYAEAAQAVARARTLSLEDPSLLVTEERLWLKAGMFAEVAERAFDQLRAAREDDQRVAAYERLAELDRSYRGDVASSVLSFQAILEVAPGHVASQRTLERYFLEQGRGEELLEVYRRMVEHMEDPDDALAYAHVAARLAVTLADGDLAMAGPILRAAFARDLADRRMIISLEAEARRAGDLALFAAAHLRGAQFAGNDQERATSFVRAAEGFLASGDRSHGVEAVEHAIAVDPNHPVALQHAAIERAANGEANAAAEACETLGRRLKTAKHAASFLHRAAAHLRPTAPERALALAREALEKDPSHTDAWTLAREVARELGDARIEMELVAMRADAPPSGERGDALTLHLRAAELALSLGDRERARAELRRVVELDPSRAEALRTLARLTWEDGDWTAAADASIRLAKLSHDPAERVEMLFRLGEIFDLRLPDTKRAEAAYRRVIQAAPDETRAHERLVALYQRTGEPVREFEVLQALTARTMPGAERIARLLRVAELAETAMADPSRAELAFEGARREAPADVEVLRLYAAFLERSAASEPRKVLLERAGAESRRAADLSPLDPRPYDMLIEVRRLRRDDVSARCIASVALCLGLRSPLIESLGSHSPEHALGVKSIAPACLELLSPPTVPPQLRTLFARAQDLLAASSPFDPQAQGAEALGARPHPLRALVDEWSEMLGIAGVELFVAADVPEVVRPIGGGSRALLVPRNVSPSLGLRFAVARAMLLDAVGLGLLVRLSPKDLALRVAALLRQFEPMHRPPNVELARLDEVARAMTRTLPRDRHAELSPIAFQVIERGPVDPEALHAGTLELGNRLALLATDDMAAAVSLLSPVEGASPAQLRATTALGRLLRVSTSDRFADARRAGERAAG